MVTLDALWLPILTATALVFVASNLVWMVLPHHRSDTRPLPAEDPALEALRTPALPPGQYRFPWVASMAEMGSPQFVAKLERGPVGVLTVMPNGPFSMGRSLGAWTAYVLVVSICVGYVACHTLKIGEAYLAVFRVTGTVAFLAYSAARVPDGVWWGKPWSTIFKEILDGLVYGLLTAGAFGWLWPR